MTEKLGQKDESSDLQLKHDFAVLAIPGAQVPDGRPPDHSGQLSLASSARRALFPEGISVSGDEPELVRWSDVAPPPCGQSDFAVPIFLS